ncbi:MAG: YfhO family protein [Clostridia bacterium]|nr:YfhO family protein [Clostridia bacterium]
MNNVSKELSVAPKHPPKQRISNLLQSGKPIWKTYWYLLFAMLIPAILMYLIYLARGIYPFGNGTVLVLDLNGQYVWFFEALRKFVYGDSSLLYSFSRALGGEFLGIYAYYIASPLSYIVCLFPENMMQEALLVLFLLKTAICGGTFGYYMHRTSKQINRFSIVLFSAFYALTSYAIVQQHNTMWIDAVMWLPLITLGIEQLIKHGKFKMYTVFLALTLFSNFYIGYMVCIYCVIYFFLYYLAHNEQFRNNPHREKRHFFKSLFRIAFFSMIAVGIASVILLSAYYSLNFGKTTFSDPNWDWKIKFDILDLLYKFLPGSFDTVRPAGLPFVYCGLLTLLLIPAYFLSDRYPMRQKIVSGIFIFIFVASFTLSVTDLIWHGFQKPNWLNYRYSFMLCFYLCVLACRAFSDFRGVSLRAMMGTAGLIALLCVVLQGYTSGEYVNPNDYTTIWFTLIMLFVYLAILALLRKTTDKMLISAVLLSAVAVELFCNGLWNLNGLDEDVAFTKHSYYANFLEKTRPIVEEVQASDDSFYRMEKTFFRKTNDNMALEIRGLSGSTSTLNKETIQFLNKMGYASKSHWSKYLGGTPVSDSLLGLKYIISDKDLYASYYEVYKTDPKNGYTAYYNPYALSIAYGVDDALLDFPLGFVTEDPDEEKDEEKSAIAGAIASLKSKLNEILGIDETVNSAEYIDEYNSPFERLNEMVTAMLGEEDTVEIFVPIKIESTNTKNLLRSLTNMHTRYTKDNPDKDAILTYSIEMPEDGELFFYMPTKRVREVELTLIKDDSPYDMGTFNGNETTRIISLGLQEADTPLSLELLLTTEYVDAMIGEYYFYYIDWDVFQDAMARLAKDQYQITDYTEDSFSGTFTASKSHELVMTTIAYDKGWEVYVDGKEVETVKALGSLVSFYVDGEAGDTHTVEMKYRPNTFHIGLWLSVGSLVLLLALIILEKRMKKIRVLRAIVGIPETEPGEPEALKAEDEEDEEWSPDLMEIDRTAVEEDASLEETESPSEEEEEPTKKDDTVPTAKNDVETP